MNVVGVGEGLSCNISAIFLPFLEEPENSQVPGQAAQDCINIAEILQECGKHPQTPKIIANASASWSIGYAFRKQWEREGKEEVKEPFNTKERLMALEHEAGLKKLCAQHQADLAFIKDVIANQQRSLNEKDRSSKHNRWLEYRKGHSCWRIISQNKGGPI